MPPLGRGQHNGEPTGIGLAELRDIVGDPALRDQAILIVEAIDKGRERQFDWLYGLVQGPLPGGAGSWEAPSMPNGHAGGTIRPPATVPGGGSP